MKGRGKAFRRHFRLQARVDVDGPGRWQRGWREMVDSRHVLAALRFERQPDSEDTERKHMDSNLTQAAFYKREGRES